MQHALTILMYHRILPRSRCTDYPLPALAVPFDVFRQQMRWLANDYRVLPLRNGLDEFRDGETSDRPLVSVTFGDRYLDNAVIAAPELEKFGCRATFFVTSEFAAYGKHEWYDRAALAWRPAREDERHHLINLLSAAADYPTGIAGDCGGGGRWIEGLRRTSPSRRSKLLNVAESLIGHELDLSGYRPISLDQVGALHSAAHEIASHTVAHSILPQLSHASLAAELSEWADQIRAWLPRRVVLRAQSGAGETTLPSLNQVPCSE